MKKIEIMEIANRRFRELEYIIEELKDTIDKIKEYCEETLSRNIDIDDSEFDLGQDTTAREILEMIGSNKE